MKLSFTTFQVMLLLSFTLQAIQIISWLSKYKPKTLVKHKLVGPILAVMCPILAEPDSRVHEDDIACERAAAEVLDTMATSLPKKHVFPPVLHFAVSNFQNPDPHYRDASVMSLGVISEGCYEVMKTRLEDVLSLVLAALKDKEQVLRNLYTLLSIEWRNRVQSFILLNLCWFLFEIL